MKTTIKQIAAGTFIAFLLLVGNVKADGTEIKAVNNEAIETTLQLENWMTSESIWNTNSINIAEYVQETEISMELEDWMINDEAWNKVYNDTDTVLAIENWMVDSNFWE